MDDNGTIKFSDIISPDDSIKSLISELKDLSSSLAEMSGSVKSTAKDVSSQLNSMSSATSNGKAAIDDAAVAVSRLAKAQKELAFAQSETGKQVAWLKSQIASQNEMSVAEQKNANSLVGSYNKLKAEIAELTNQWKALSESQRASSVGTKMLSDIDSLKIKLRELDNQLKGHVTRMTEVEKLRAKLSHLMSEEGKEVLELRKQIRELTSARSSQREATDEVAKAMERLQAATSNTRIEAYEYNIQAKEADRVARLTAQVNTSAVGSYNQLAAQYELNKIKLNALSHEERANTEAGKELEAETLAIYRQMIKLQEAAGNHRLSVGNYKLAWNGLGNAMNQIVRELPSMTMGINTFFLAISNNVPILIDEIKRVKAENKALAADGKKTTSVTQTIVSSLFSWQSALVLLLTALSMNGKAILNWIGKVIFGNKSVVDLKAATEDITEELKKNTGTLGENVVTLKRLSEEWQRLSSKKEQIQWIRDNKSEFDKLDISINSVTDAENAFVNNTDMMIEALKARAQAAAAVKLASEKYGEALEKQIEAENVGYEYEYQTDPKTGKIKAVKVKSKPPKGYGVKGAQYLGTSPSALIPIWGDESDPDGKKSQARWERDNEIRRKGLEKEAAEVEATADAYFRMAQAYTVSENEIYKRAGFSRAHKALPKEKKPKEKKVKEKKGREPRDVENQVWRNDLSIRKKYEISITELMRDEYQKRRIEAVDSTNQMIRELQEKYRKNEEFLANKEGKFKVSSEVRKQIQEQQEQILATVENYRTKLDIELKKIDQEQAIELARILRYAPSFQLKNMEEDLEKEKQLALEHIYEIEDAYQSAQTKIKLANRDAGKMEVTDKGFSAYELSEVEIQAVKMTDEELARLRKKRLELEAEYDTKIYSLKASNVDAQLELVKKGSQEEIELLKQRNEIAMQLALAENILKPVEQQLDPEIIKQLFDKRDRLSVGQKTFANFTQEQQAAEARFEVVKRNEYMITMFKLKAEKDRWAKQIEMAKSGALDWSDAQLEYAKAMLDKLTREINEKSKLIYLIADKGLGGALLTKLGFDDEFIDAITEATNITLDNIKQVIDAEVELAETMVSIAEKRVEAAKSAYEAEIEARNNGYANNVATAKKELQQEKKNQAAKLRILAAAQRRQEAIDTAMQISSLVTATANLWKSYSSMGPFSVAAAIAATAAMWGSFAYAKIKAAQLSKQKTELEETYGEGGLEILEGGSHASGNDIDLHTKNSRGKNMRAEGGEAMAIINKRSTRKYRKALPGIIDSLNKGIFEDKYLKAFENGETLQAQFNATSQQIDLKLLENEVQTIRKQNSERVYSIGDGTTLVIKNNVKRYIR